MQAQPPRDAPTPSPSEVAIRSRRKSAGMQIGVLLVVLGLAVVILSPMVRRQRKKAIECYANNNLRQIGLWLFEFQQEYAKLPDASTIPAVKKATGTPLSLGTRTSNDYFRQLIASGFAPSENAFYAEIPGIREPDNRMDALHALEKGECGFTYLMGGTKDSNPSRPVVVTPMIPNTDRFDPSPFGSSADILKYDNSVSPLRIEKDGHAIFAGRILMDPSNPIWEGHPPVIAWPE